jgi:hypothetical protein
MAARLRSPSSKPDVIHFASSGFPTVFPSRTTCRISFAMNGVMAGLANDECFASSLQHDLCEVGSSFSHAFQVYKFADMVNDSVLTFDRTKFACARYESSYHLLLFIANGEWESINQDSLFLVFERTSAESGNQRFLSACALFGDS